MEIVKAYIQPNTQGVMDYTVGKETYYKSGLTITAIVSREENGVTYLDVYANEKLYAVYVNVPFVVYFQ